MAQKASPEWCSSRSESAGCLLFQALDSQQTFCLSQRFAAHYLSSPPPPSSSPPMLVMRNQPPPFPRFSSKLTRPKLSRLPRKDALPLASQTLLSSCKLGRQYSKHDMERSGRSLGGGGGGCPKRATRIEGAPPRTRTSRTPGLKPSYRPPCRSRLRHFCCAETERLFAHLINAPLVTSAIQCPCKAQRLHQTSKRHRQLSLNFHGRPMQRLPATLPPMEWRVKLP
ncbi:hypothetical protein LX36DRAFT_478672 [Colletotrichum falcatum]|nr:hypothetical protein LX36DRAFT_478672 [Colletotrichum falcatum]